MNPTRHLLFILNATLDIKSEQCLSGIFIKVGLQGASHFSLELAIFLPPKFFADFLFEVRGAFLKINKFRNSFLAKFANFDQPTFPGFMKVALKILGSTRPVQSFLRLLDTSKQRQTDKQTLYLHKSCLLKNTLCMTLLLTMTHLFASYLSTHIYLR